MRWPRSRGRGRAVHVDLAPRMVLARQSLRERHTRHARQGAQAVAKRVRRRPEPILERRAVVLGNAHAIGRHLQPRRHVLLAPQVDVLHELHAWPARTAERPSRSRSASRSRPSICRRSGSRPRPPMRAAASARGHGSPSARGRRPRSPPPVPPAARRTAPCAATGSHGTRREAAPPRARSTP